MFYAFIVGIEFVIIITGVTLFVRYNNRKDD